jgi:hypothetical protein
MKQLFNQVKLSYLLVLGLAGLMLHSCDQDPKFSDLVPDYAYSIIRSFEVNGELAEINHTNAVVTHTLPAGTNLTSVSVNMTLPEGAVVQPASGSSVDFSNGPVVFTVTNNGIARKYTVTVAAFGDPMIMTFAIGDNQGVIDHVNGAIAVTVGSQADITRLTPLYTIPGGTTATPESGVAQNFTNPVKYSVISNDGFTGKSYFVNVTQIAGPQITKFEVNGQEATIFNSTRMISLTLPPGTNLNNLAPVITLPPGQTISPASGVARNFSAGPLTYTVTNTEGLTAEYTVNITAGSLPIAFIGDGANVNDIQDDDARAAALFLQATYQNDFRYIPFANISAQSLMGIKVVMLYYLSPLPNLGYSASSDNVMGMLPPQLRPGTSQSQALTNYVKNGGHLFIAGDPTPFIHVTGRVPADYTVPPSPGNYQYTEFGCAGAGGCVDLNKPPDDIWGLSVKVANTSSDRRNHPIFNGLTLAGNGELYLQNSGTREVRLIWWQHFDNRMNGYTCCGTDGVLVMEKKFNAVKLGTLRWIGDGFGVGAIEYLPTNGSVNADFDFNIPTDFNGRIISLENTIIGYEFDSNGTVNQYQNNLETFTRNIIDYLRTL